MSAFRLVNSTVSNSSYHEEITEPIGKAVEIVENTSAFMRLKGYNTQTRLACSMELALANTPNFLHKQVEISLDHILVISNTSFRSPSSYLFDDEILNMVLSLKLLLQCLEELYVYSASKLSAGLLLVLNEGQENLMSAFEEIISYAETYSHNREEKTLIFIPTDVASYDFFLELKEEMEKELDQLLWSNQRFSPLIRHYLKTTAIMR